MDLVDYIYDECHRQHVTNYGDFAKALDFVSSLTDREKQLLEMNFGQFVQQIAYLVDPDVNPGVVRGDRYDNLRTSHVGFMHGGTASPAGEVRERFDRWCEFTFEYVGTNLDGPIADRSDTEITDRLIKMLLDIHPWSDGNGRTSSILRNWMLNTLDDPEPLPYYYGQA